MHVLAFINFTHPTGGHPPLPLPLATPLNTELSLVLCRRQSRRSGR